MLKITHVESPSARVVQLEGRLLDPWVPVVQETVEGIFPSDRDVTLDLTCLTFASADGIALLSRLRRRGVRFVGCSQLIHFFLCAEHGEHGDHTEHGEHGGHDQSEGPTT